MTSEERKAYEFIQHKMSDAQRKNLFAKHNHRNPDDMDEFWDWVDINIDEIAETETFGYDLNEENIFWVDFAGSVRISANSSQEAEDIFWDMMGQSPFNSIKYVEINGIEQI